MSDVPTLPSGPEATMPLPEGVTAEVIAEELEKICQHPIFSTSPNLQRFLNFTVATTLRGREAELKEYTIAVSVFGRREDFDPRNASIVRTQAGKLRAKLREYYAVTGMPPVYVVYRPGSYAPTFETTPGESVVAGPAERVRAALVPARKLRLGVELAGLAEGLEKAFEEALRQESGLLVMADGRGEAAAYLLERTMFGEGELSLAMRAVRTVDGVVVWTATFDLSKGELEGQTAELARRMAGAVSAGLRDSGATGKRRAYRTTAELRRRCEEGAFLCDRLSEMALERAERAFEEVLRREPEYAPAHAGLSRCQVHRAWIGLAPSAVLWPVAKSAALRAVACDPAAAGALATVHCVFEGKGRQGRAEYETALKHEGADYQVLAAYGLFGLMPAGERGRGLEVLGRALELAPVSTMARCALGWGRYLAEEYGEAEREFRTILDLDPACAAAAEGLWRCLAANGGEAGEMMSVAGALSEAVRPALECATLAVAGDAERAWKMLQQVERGSGREYVSRLHLGLAWLKLGEEREALKQVEMGARERAFGLGWLGVDPAWERVRGAERFRRVVESLEG